MRRYKIVSFGNGEKHLKHPRKASSPVASESHEDGKILLFTTKTCPNCPNAKRQLASAGIEYEAVDAEEHAALAEKYGIKSVPTLVAGNKVITGVGPIIGWIKENRAEAI